jgi:hypothetical protein
MFFQSPAAPQALHEVGADDDSTYERTACPPHPETLEHFSSSMNEAEMRTLDRLTLAAGAVLGLSAWLGPVPLSHLRSQASLVSDPMHELLCAGNHSNTGSVLSGDGA